MSIISTFAGLIIFVFIGSVVVYFFIHVGDGVLCSYESSGSTHTVTYSI